MILELLYSSNVKFKTVQYSSILVLFVSLKYLIPPSIRHAPYSINTPWSTLPQRSSWHPILTPVPPQESTNQKITGPINYQYQPKLSITSMKMGQHKYFPVANIIFKVINPQKWKFFFCKNPTKSWHVYILKIIMK